MVCAMGELRADRQGDVSCPCHEWFSSVVCATLQPAVCAWCVQGRVSVELQSPDMRWLLGAVDNCLVTWGKQCCGAIHSRHNNNTLSMMGCSATAWGFEANP